MISTPATIWSLPSMIRPTPLYMPCIRVDGIGFGSNTYLVRWKVCWIKHNSHQLLVNGSTENQRNPRFRTHGTLAPGAVRSTAADRRSCRHPASAPSRTSCCTHRWPVVAEYCRPWTRNGRTNSSRTTRPRRSRRFCRSAWCQWDRRGCAGCAWAPRRRDARQFGSDFWR